MLRVVVISCLLINHYLIYLKMGHAFSVHLHRYYAHRRSWPAATERWRLQRHVPTAVLFRQQYRIWHECVHDNCITARGYPCSVVEIRCLLINHYLNYLKMGHAFSVHIHRYYAHRRSWPAATERWRLQRHVPTAVLFRQQYRIWHECVHDNCITARGYRSIAVGRNDLRLVDISYNRPQGGRPAISIKCIVHHSQYGVSSE